MYDDLKKEERTNLDLDLVRRPWLWVVVPCFFVLLLVALARLSCFVGVLVGFSTHLLFLADLQRKSEAGCVGGLLWLLFAR